MKIADYGTLLALLDSAKLLLANNAGDLSPADLRIRSLVNITGKEAQRALLEMNASAAHPPTEPAPEDEATRKAAARQVPVNRGEPVRVR